MRQPFIAGLALLLPLVACGGTTAKAPTRSATSATSIRSLAGRPVPPPSGDAVAVRPALRPIRIVIPAIGVDAAMTKLGIAADGSIEVPADPARAGWLDRTPSPGQQGPSVIAGHVDSMTGPAVFYHLAQLREGEKIVVGLRDGASVTFVVDEVRTYAKSSFPTRATYGPVPVPALRLITCGGPYDEAAGGYQDNVVVFASEV